MRISDWSSDVCSSDLLSDARRPVQQVRIDAARAQVVDEATRIQRGDDAAGRRNFSVVGHSVVISQSNGGIRQDGAPVTAQDAIHKARSEEHTSELQSLMRISYAVFCLKKKTNNNKPIYATRDVT